MLKSKQWVVLILLIIFVLPGVCAYWFYTHPAWLSQHTTNKGQLLAPPLFAKSLAHDDKWHLILWHPKTCHLACRQQLDKLSRIRLALGRRFYEVQLTLVTRDRPVNVSKQLTRTLRRQHIQWTSAVGDTDGFLKLVGENQILIANRQHYLILSYSLDTDSEDIFSDLQRLIK